MCLLEIPFAGNSDLIINCSQQHSQQCHPVLFRACLQRSLSNDFICSCASTRTGVGASMGLLPELCPALASQAWGHSLVPQGHSRAGFGKVQRAVWSCCWGHNSWITVWCRDCGALQKWDFFPALVEFCGTSPLPSMQGLE